MSYRSFLDLDTINTMILLLITGLYQQIVRFS